MEKLKWYFRLPTVVLAVLALGPFALPLVWKNPSLSKRSRMLISVLILALTIWMISVSVNVAQLILKEAAELQKAF